MKTTTAVLLTLLLTGCMSITIGQPFDPAYFKGLAVGVTTPAEVLKHAGIPWMRQQASDGSEVWVYVNGHLKSRAWAVPFYAESATRSQSTSVALRFRNGVLTETQWAETAH